MLVVHYRRRYCVVGSRSVGARRRHSHSSNSIPDFFEKNSERELDPSVEFGKRATLHRGRY
jgi:hypothetical protein